MYPPRNNIMLGLEILCSLTSVATDACYGSTTLGIGTLAQPYYPPAAHCEEYLVPLPITAEQAVFNATKWETPYDLEAFFSTLTTRPSAGFAAPLTAPVTLTKTVEIAASFCTPKKTNGKEKTVILATHGIGPARVHWNSPHKPDEYNFVQWAIGQGYSVFFYDRLGTGASQKLSGFSTQLNTAVAVLQELAKKVRAGEYTGNLGKPNKLALMGFSFGSYTTHTAIVEQPEIADAVILTAIGFNETGLNVNGLLRSFVPRIANVQNPLLYGDRDNGYLTWPDKFAQIHNYFHQPNYEEAAADFAEIVKQPYPVAEFLTLLSGPKDASNYTGPVLAISGEYDYIFCDGYCPGIFEEPGKTYYKNANRFEPDLSYFRIIQRAVAHSILGVSTGMLVFPAGPHSGFNNVMPSGMAIYLTSIITGQLVLTLGGSGFCGALSSMLVEILPLLREIAGDIQGQLGQGSISLVPTTLTAYALCSFLIGGIFLVLGVFHCGFVVGYFPSTVLDGIIGSIGVELVIISLELTLPTSSPNLEWATAGEILFSPRQLPLLFATICPALLLLVSTKLDIFSRFTLGFTRNPLYIPIFMIVLASFFWVGAAATGRAHLNTLDGLVDDGWLFPVTGRKDFKISIVLEMANYWRLFDFSKVQWSAIGGPAKNIALVVIIAVLNLPIAVSALKQGLGATADIDRELFGSAAGNILAGAVGTIPNLIVFSYSRLFTEARGGRWESFTVTLLTASLLFIGPMILPYLPTILASVLVLYLGIDLVLEATWESFKTLHWLEFSVFLGSLLASTFLGFAIGLGVGIGLAIVIHCVYSACDSVAKAVPYTTDHTQALSLQKLHVVSESSDEALTKIPFMKLNGFISKKGREQLEYPDFQVIEMSGYSFFATLPSLEKSLNLVAARSGNTTIIIDMSNVVRLETSVGKLIKQKFSVCSRAEEYIHMALAGIMPNSGVRADLKRAGLNCRFIYEPSEKTCDNISLSKDEIPTFRTLQQANAWREELSNNQSKPMTDDKVLDAFKVISDSSGWSFGLNTFSRDDLCIIRGIKGETLDLKWRDCAFILISGRLAIKINETAGENTMHYLSRPSVSMGILYLARIFTSWRRDNSTLEADGSEENMMIPLRPTSNLLKQEQLLPGDTIVFPFRVHGIDDMLRVVVQSDTWYILAGTTDVTSLYMQASPIDVSRTDQGRTDQCIYQSNDGKLPGETGHAIAPGWSQYEFSRRFKICGGLRIGTKTELTMNISEDSTRRYSPIKATILLTAAFY
ncbi:hypothetical protein B7463_g9030, partial [Scytalidium lignicola]